MTSKFFAWAACLAIAPVSALIIPATAAATTSCGLVVTHLSTGAVTELAEYPGVFQVPLILTNTDPQESCTVQGYLNVVLIGPDDPTWGSTWQLRQQSGDPQPLTLGPGDSANSVLTYLPAGPDDWLPSNIVAVLPDSDAPEVLSTPWIPGGITLVRQDGATSPATYIGPLQSTE